MVRLALSIFALIACCLLPQGVFAADVPSLLKEGDRLDSANQNEQALSLFLQADELRPGDSEILRRIAKQYAQLMEDTRSRAEKKRLGTLALDHALLAVQANPQNGQARLSLAICYGKVAFLEPPQKRMEYSRLILEEAEAATRLSPRDALAWHVLGRWHYEVANLNPALRTIAQSLFGRFPNASNEKALQYLQRAAELDPASILFHTELGRAYARQGESEKARKHLNQALQLPPTAKEDKETQERARTELAKLPGK